MPLLPQADFFSNNLMLALSTTTTLEWDFEGEDVQPYQSYDEHGDGYQGMTSPADFGAGYDGMGLLVSNAAHPTNGFRYSGVQFAYSSATPFQMTSWSFRYKFTYATLSSNNGDYIQIALQYAPNEWTSYYTPTGLGGRPASGAWTLIQRTFNIDPIYGFRVRVWVGSQAVDTSTALDEVKLGILVPDSPSPTPTPTQTPAAGATVFAWHFEEQGDMQPYQSFDEHGDGYQVMTSPADFGLGIGGVGRSLFALNAAHPSNGYRYSGLHFHYTSAVPFQLQRWELQYRFVYSNLSSNNGDHVQISYQTTPGVWTNYANVSGLGGRPGSGAWALAARNVTTGMIYGFRVRVWVGSKLPWVNTSVDEIRLTFLVPTPTPTETPTPTATPTDTPTAPTLADYGINTSGPWTQPELDAILAGVTKAGQALQSQYGGSSPADAFNRVMYFPDRSVIELVRSTDSGFVCETDNDNVAPPVQSRITCLANVIVTEYTVAHELGHVLVGRTGGYLAQDPNANNNPSYYGLSEQGTLLDGNNELVYGYYLDENNADQWERGNRGWGSSSIPYSAQQACEFQQNPAVESGRTTHEVDEGAADMFLNWVYREVNTTGFKNVDWRTYVTCSLTGSTDQWTTGDRRYNWMDNTTDGIMTRLGNDRNW